MAVPKHDRATPVDLTAGRGQADKDVRRAKQTFDVAIIGGGPAGSTAGRLLAQWGYSVVILNRPPGKAPSLAECLPPSISKVFAFLGIQKEIDRAGFYRTTGNTVWWGKAKRRVEKYDGGLGYQVLRSDFDRLLLQLAVDAGAVVPDIHMVRDLKLGKLAVEWPDRKRTRIAARFVLDCSGRTGVVAHRFRSKQSGSHTVGLCGVWQLKGGWPKTDATHTLVETYRNGWAWSVPLSPEIRYVTVMVDAGGKNLETTYRAELAKTRVFAKLTARATLETGPWGCDASLYTSCTFAGPGFLLVGDAASFIDPLSSFGVKKAMVSAWVAAVVTNTFLQRPEMCKAALDFYNEREREIYSSYLRESSAYFGQPETSEEDAVAMRAAFEKLKKQSSIRLRRAKGIVQGMQFYRNVSLPTLADLAESFRQVPDLFEAYNRTCPPVSLPDFLGALSFLLARGILL